MIHYERFKENSVAMGMISAVGVAMHHRLGEIIKSTPDSCTFDSIRDHSLCHPGLENRYGPLCFVTMLVSSLGIEFGAF